MERLPALGSPTSRFVSTKSTELSSSKSTAVGNLSGDGRPSPMDRHTPLPPIRTSPERGGPDERLRFSSQKDDWPRIPVNGQASRDNSTGSHRYHPPHHSSYYDDHNNPAGAGPYKRKRSDGSDEGHRRSPPDRHQLPYEPASEPRPLEHRPYAGRASSPRRESYPAPSQSAYPPLSGDGRQNPSSREETWYGPRSQGSRAPQDALQSTSTGHGINSDAQLAEALQRETQNLESNQGTSTGGSPDDDEPNGQPHRGSEYGADRTPTTGVAVDHRRRKRVFSNRTKTGCLTCRRRKKKCDEQKPDCNNCIRGGFVCEGYSSRIEWQNKSREKPPVPLQAKESPQSPLPPGGSGGGGGGGGVRHNPLGGPPPRAERSPPAYQQYPKQVSRESQGASTRPILIEDDRDLERPRITTSSDGNAPGPVPFQKNLWPPPNIPHLSDPSHLRPEPSRIPPSHESRRPGEMDYPTPSSAISHHYPLHVHSPQAASKTDAQAQAQLALQHQAALRSRTRTEKDKMLSGEPYRPDDPELVYERERCKAALWRFNSSMNPNLGISRDERARLFRDILKPRDGPPPANEASPVPPGPIGRVGANVVVEAPFNCDYGYNICVEQDVHIGLNCTIMDPCAVNIGPRTVIGPNVSILTATMSVEPRGRSGAQGPWKGRAITIQEDCWIGAGAIILPGLHIGRGATVGAGSVVTRNVPAGTVVAGNPARVLRLLPNDSDDEGHSTGGHREATHSSPTST